MGKSMYRLCTIQTAGISIGMELYVETAVEGDNFDKTHRTGERLLRSSAQSLQPFPV